MPSQPPRVFISYSHDSELHSKRVLALANQLRGHGIETRIDQYVGDPDEGWPMWMRNQVLEADRVLLVFTETFARRFLGKEVEGSGLGVTFEGVVATQALYESGARNAKFRPVVFTEDDESFIPVELRRFNRYRVDTQDEYQKLLWWLHEAPRIVVPTVGQKPDIPPEPAPKLFPSKPEEPRDPTASLFPKSPPGAADLKEALSNLPDRNRFFTGREPVLAQLEESLAAQGRAALSGLGGVGKTQTAVEYAHRHAEEYLYTFFVTAHSWEALVSGYATIAGLLKLSEADAQDQTLVVGAVQRWLSSHKGWLLILDNADDLDMAHAFLPSGKKGHVILTTRAHAVGAIARRVEIQEMGTDEGALFILRRSRCIAEDAPPKGAAEADQETAKKLVTQLDRLPLALDQAGAYIEKTGCGLSGYLSRYRTHGPELLRRRGSLKSDHPDPVATTWALSFENIAKANPAAAELLRLCAFLHPDQIPEEIFNQGAPELGPVLRAVGADELALDEAVSEVFKYSLLRRNPNARILEIHRLVQAVLKQGMDEATQRLWAGRAVRAVTLAFPPVEFSSWTDCDRLLPHARACAELVNQWGFEFPEAADLLNWAGLYLYGRGRYTDAEPLYGRALAIREKTLGPEHLGVANSLNNLAVLYRAQGQYAKAEPLFQRALTIRKKVLGPEHPYLATSLNNLAGLYDTQGQYAKAEPLYLRALATREMAVGPEHPGLALSLNNLAVLYYHQGRYAEAEPLFHRALAIREKALGPQHPHLAESLNSLAELYRAQGQYAKAEPLYQQALAIREKALGPQHPKVATSLDNYARLLRDVGRAEEAEALAARARAIRTKSA
jgi:tetratricopeptide (TPR) repeat protein